MNTSGLGDFGHSGIAPQKTPTPRIGDIKRQFFFTKKLNIGKARRTSTRDMTGGLALGGGLTFTEGSKKMLGGNRLYLLLVVVPFALLAETLEFSPGLSFALSCLAILPLAGLLGEATEQATHSPDMRTGHSRAPSPFGRWRCTRTRRCRGC